MHIVFEKITAYPEIFVSFRRLSFQNFPPAVGFTSTYEGENGVLSHGNVQHIGDIILGHVLQIVQQNECFFSFPLSNNSVQVFNYSLMFATEKQDIN